MSFFGSLFRVVLGRLISRSNQEPFGETDGNFLGNSLRDCQNIRQKSCTERNFALKPWFLDLFSQLREKFLAHAFDADHESISKLSISLNKRKADVMLMR